MLTEERNPHKIDNKVLKNCADKLINIFTRLMNDAKRDLKLLPVEAQGNFKLGVTYTELMAKMIINSPTYDEHMKLNKINLAISCLKSLYFG